MKKVTKKAAKKKVTKKVAKKTTKKAAKKTPSKEKTTKSPLTKAQINKFKKLEDEADNNTEMTGYFMDEFDYCYGNLAEDLCYAGDKEWARRIYKIVEDKMGIQISGDQHLSFAADVANNLGDKEWARKIYKEAEDSGNFDKDELASAISNDLGDEKWAKKIRGN